MAEAAATLQYTVRQIHTCKTSFVSKKTLFGGTLLSRGVGVIQFFSLLSTR